MLAKPMSILRRSDEKVVEDCELILDCYSQVAKVLPESSNNRDWAHGRKHIFLSEGARQQLETLRIDIKNKSATRIQAVFRGHLIRRKMKKVSTNLNLMVQPSTRSRPKPISCTPPPLDDIIHSDRCDFRIIQQTCSLFGLDLVRKL